ncbi:MAG TPA: excinuclease ABC subunit UvrC [Candidatus Avidehalobacter gallistercoris]|uniref:UvrABC system protein C n=1 Tax=Candidatus Avidehalobacter gallistercoris TaxID=2840694 RepID=A0A9D1KYT2_9FIRM|nr:excinuclease ABC subunit UvrC [Candidatus Avidehalobacter gallistercoris]
MANPKLKEKLALLPDSPGVYIMRDKDGQVVYVGKAKSLRQRVRSYFQPESRLAPKTAAQMRVVDELEWIVVSSAAEALVLECNLIKEYNPKYNILLRDDKHYPYLCLTMREEYPRLIMVRSVKNDGNRYFGPYVSSGAMKLTQKLLSDIFPLRSCSNQSFSRKHRPCLNFHIGRCLAPCTGKVDREKYREMCEQVALFLEGKSGAITARLQDQMQQAAAELRFEDAAVLRDRIEAVKLVQSRQNMDSGSDNRDMLAAATAGNMPELAAVQIFFVREGKVVGREHFFLQNPGGDDPGAILAAFIGQYYSGVDFIPPEICLSHEPPDPATLAEWLSAKRGGKVTLNVPKIGEKKRLLSLVEQNVRLVISREMEEKNYAAAASGEALEELRQTLDLPKAPWRIECFDNSHWQGTYTVSAMVTFLGGKPAKALYRHMRIKGETNGDDYMAMREAVARRLGWGINQRQQLKRGEIKPEEAPMAEWPDLLLIDGGKGQLAVAVDILEALQLDIPVFGLAESEEWIYRPHDSEPIILPKSSHGLQLLQRVRDEAHRFGITYQRRLREKGQKASALDNIPGIGPTRRAALLRAFGSLEQIMQASVEELSLAESMNRRAAASLYDYLHTEKQ